MAQTQKEHRKDTETDRREKNVDTNTYMSMHMDMDIYKETNSGHRHAVIITKIHGKKVTVDLKDSVQQKPRWVKNGVNP
jgi:hypothetical protein